jgi:hypothetical protein
MVPFIDLAPGGIMFRKLNRKTVVVVGVVSLVAAGGAYAYWTNGGTGTGSAASGNNVGITVTQTTDASGLYPGGPAVVLSGKFNNTNSGPVHVHQVIASIATVTGGPLVDGAHTCTITDYSLTNATATVDADIPSGTAVGAWTGPSIQMVNAATNQDGCKGGTVALAYTSN